VVPATPADQALANLAALILNQRGHSAQVWTQTDRPTSAPYLLAGEPEDSTTTKDDRRLTGRLSSVGGKDIASLLDLLNVGPTLPTQITAVRAN